MNLSRLVDWLGALRVVGISSACWRAFYQWECASGQVRRRTPVRSWDEVAADAHNLPPPNKPYQAQFFFFDHNLSIKKILPCIDSEATRELKTELAAIEGGAFPFWGGTREGLGFPPAWNQNLLTGRDQPADRHWSQITEESTGDVKGLWELSRFTVVFRLARIYAYCDEEQAAELFWRLVESWLEANPPECGPQWISAQEVSLRLMAWEFGSRAFAKSPRTTAERQARLEIAIGEHARRIEATISYARSQNNNHMISEAAALLTAGLMHLQLPGASRWEKLGRALLEESQSQFLLDGGYIQHSHNYHRFALQLMVWSMRLAELHRRPLSNKWYARMRASLAFLRAMVDPASGHISNLGHNDGTHFLPLSACGYADYRPLLQTLSVWLKEPSCLQAGPWDEEAVWLVGNSETIPETTKSQLDKAAFPAAGLYQLRGKESWVNLRAAHFTSRPAHADQLHADLWWRGENVAIDAGSYLYSGDPPWRNPFAGALTHNAVLVDGLEPMRRSGRFLWTELAQAKVLRFDDAGWTAEHDGYRSLGVTLQREVTRIGADTWKFVDEITGTGCHRMQIHWLVPDVKWEWKNPVADGSSGQRTEEKIDTSSRTLTFSFPMGSLDIALQASQPIQWMIIRAGEVVFDTAKSRAGFPSDVFGWRSERYGSKHPALSLLGLSEGVCPLRITSIWGDASTPIQL